MQVELEELTGQQIANLALTGKPMPRYLCRKESEEAHKIIIESKVDENVKRAAFLVVDMGTPLNALQALLSMSVAFMLYDTEAKEELNAVKELLKEWHVKNA